MGVFAKVVLTKMAEHARAYGDLLLRPGRQRSVLQRHPWVFASAVGHKPNVATGSIVRVCDDEGILLGLGHYDTASKIICRIFSFGNVTIGVRYWQDTIAKALSYRRSTMRMDHITGFRLINAEGDNMPGIVVDVFGKAACVQIRTPGAVNILPCIRDFLSRELDVQSVYVAHAEELKQVDGWHGTEQECLFEEYGVYFDADVHGQKTG